MMKRLTSTYLALLITILFTAVQAEAEVLANNDAEFSTNKLNGSTNNKSWYFDAYLDDDLIGFHTYKMQESPDETTITSEAEFDIRFMFITLYSYRHNNTEIWSNNCLKKLNASTDDNGEQLSVKLFKAGSNSYIETGDSKISKQSCVRSFAYWDLELINSNSLLNSQTGELIAVSFQHIGTEDYKLNNHIIETEHYRLQGNDRNGEKIEIDLWYASGNQWVGLESKLANGNTLRYQLNTGGA